MSSKTIYTSVDYTPYTYFIRWNELNLNYYGKRTARGCHPEEFFVDYFTSSKLVADVIAEYGMPDIIKIHKIFCDAMSCNIQEEKFLKRVDAARSIKWLNQRNGGAGWDTSGIPKTEKQKEKLRLANTGKRVSNITKLKISASSSGSLNHQYGKTGKLSPNYNKINITNGVENSKIWKNDGIPDGWWRGQAHRIHKERSKETKPRKRKPPERMETKALKSKNTSLRKKFVCCVLTKKNYSKPHAILYLPWVKEYV